MPASPLSPPGTTERVHAQRVLVLAPHYDDETYGCGGLLAQLVADGAAVRIQFLTDSRGGEEPVADRLAYGATRRAEAEAAAAALGIDDLAHAGLRDGGLDQVPEAMADLVADACEAFRPDLVLTPSPLETSGDHRATFRAVHETLGHLRPDDPRYPWAEELVVLAYDVNHPLYPSLLVDTSEVQATVEEAAACYVSQEARHGYAAARRGLSHFRTLSLDAGVTAAEGYVRLRLDDFTTRGPAALVQHLGGAPTLLPVAAGPRLSVVVRTRDRPALLAQALGSLARSTYQRAEVVLVNDGGTTPTVPDDFPMPVVRVDLPTNRGRAAAANAGVEAAGGEAICFLDDDDLVEPEHLATLAGLMGGADVRVAYTDAAVGVYEADGDDGWRCHERRLPYSRDFDADRLLVDNYIPFNTLVIDRALFDEVGPFDVGLAFFEDWEWLIRCAQRTPFHHLARVTCEYRQFRASGHHILGDRPRERADFLATKAKVLAKHLSLATPERLAAIVDSLRADEVAAREAARAATSRAATSRHRAEQLNGELAAARSSLDIERVSAERLAAALEHAEGSLRGRDEELARRGRHIERLGDEAARTAEALAAAEGETERLRAHHAELDGQLAATYAEIERLGGVIRDMESTRAWRMHAWWQSRRA